ncbi:YrhK family protein [Paenisporosarcina sp. TG20]|uniref:YrhK family protein n=1 Tax=Paenisporosarcina sp. TG20 TaxID=1211706 RepID=UPI0002F6CE95|nr:YrhK family protein [Paenisporosarcina sp. TG20]
MQSNKDNKDFFYFHMGTFEVSFDKKYRIIALLNDLTLGLEFLIGSILFLSESTQTAGVILFIIGSVQLLSRPLLKILHAFHFSRKNRTYFDNSSE